MMTKKEKVLAMYNVEAVNPLRRSFFNILKAVMIVIAAYYFGLSACAFELDEINFENLSFTEEWCAPTSLGKISSSKTDSIPKFKSGGVWVEYLKDDNILTIHNAFNGLVDIKLDKLTKNLNSDIEYWTAKAALTDGHFDIRCNDILSGYTLRLEPQSTTASSLIFKVYKYDNGTIQFKTSNGPYKLYLYDPEGNLCSYKGYSKNYMPIQLSAIKFTSFVPTGTASDNLQFLDFTNDGSYFSLNNRSYNVLTSSANSTKGKVTVYNFANSGEKIYNHTIVYNTTKSSYLEGYIGDEKPVNISYDCSTGVATISTGYCLGFYFEYYNNSSSSTSSSTPVLLKKLCAENSKYPDYAKLNRLSGDLSTESKISGTVKYGGFTITQDGDQWGTQTSRGIKVLATKLNFEFPQLYCVGRCQLDGHTLTPLRSITDMKLSAPLSEPVDVTDSEVPSPEIEINAYGCGPIYSNSNARGIYVNGQIIATESDIVKGYNLYLMPGNHSSKDDDSFDNATTGNNYALLINQEKYYSEYVSKKASAKSTNKCSGVIVSDDYQPIKLAKRFGSNKSSATDLNSNGYFNLVVPLSDFESLGVNCSDIYNFTLYVQTVYDPEYIDTASDESVDINTVTTFGSLTSLTQQMITTSAADISADRDNDILDAITIVGRDLIIPDNLINSIQINTILGLNIPISPSLTLSPGLYIISAPGLLPKKITIK
jgi:hypothetical protein